jgi:DNA-directed RNA polymerase specialized sigma24 family protein
MHARDRDVLLLHAWGDLDYEGIAQALDLPIGTVRSRLNRARRLLRTATNRGAALTLEGAKWTS